MSRTKRSPLLAVAVVLIGLNTMLSSCAALTPKDLDTMAQEAYAAENWKDAAGLYAALNQQQPANGRYWYRAAVALRHLQEYGRAYKALSKAADNQVPASFVDYERAKIAAAHKAPKKAIEWLTSAAAAGLAGKDKVLGEPLLAALAGEPGFDALIKKLDSNQFPCGGEEFHRFDFWVGDWEVTTAGGQVAGTNKISRRENDCVLLEEWTSGSGGTGISMNFYDAVAGKWVQQWISSGTQIHIEGDIVAGSMVLVGHIYYITGKTRADFRGTWTLLDDGRVRQFFEQADAEGNWSPWFEGFYKRVE